MKVAVVGAGIAGLAAAWAARDRAEVTVWEPGHLGGRIRTEDFAGHPVDCGPDAFILRSPDGLALCAEAGVDDLVHPRAGTTLLWWDSSLRALPDGLVLGVPRRLGPLFASRLLSPRGLLRAAGDLLLPASPPAGDVTVHDLVARRFGTQVAERLVDPLVGSIHAGATSALSAGATVPQLVAAARRSRSLLLSLRAGSAAAPAGPMFAAPRGGMEELVTAVVGGLRRAGASFEAAEVTAVVPERGRWRLEPSGGSFDRVVLATDDRTAARLLGPRAPDGLGSVPRASVALVTLGYRDLYPPAGVNGILVPRTAGLLTTAVSFGSSKWPHWSAPGRAVLRVSTGRYGDDRASGLDDATLVGRLAEEVGLLLGRDGSPDRWRVSRWPDSFPQYVIGHLERVGRIEAALAKDFPGVAVCGSSYHGAGIPACIASGRQAAGALLAA